MKYPHEFLNDKTIFSYHILDWIDFYVVTNTNGGRSILLYHSSHSMIMHLSNYLMKISLA